jgi:hypothetical protein
MVAFNLKPLPPPTEHAEQCALMDWAQMAYGKHPELRWLYATPNGGFRHPSTAAKLKAEGAKAGVCDLFLPVPRKGHHGLYIELKRTKGGRLSPEQVDFIDFVTQHGYLAVVCKGWIEAKDTLLDYLAA